MDNKTKLLKISFWIGAITDALAAKVMIIPKLRTFIFGTKDYVETSGFIYALGLGAALMIGWTVLLIWGSFNPKDRRGLLIITVFPVIIGIILAQVYAVISGYIEINRFIPIWIYLTLISGLFIYSYITSKD